MGLARPLTSQEMTPTLRPHSTRFRPRFRLGLGGSGDTGGSFFVIRLPVGQLPIRNRRVGPKSILLTLRFRTDVQHHLFLLCHCQRSAACVIKLRKTAMEPFALCTECRR